MNRVRMDWRQLDWAALDRLRGIFLRGEAVAGPYWRHRADLTAYDATYGERIGWKWDAVLAELSRRGWHPSVSAINGQSRRPAILDWGCGSGIAGRRVAAWLGAERVAELRCWDHSEPAVQFAVERAQAIFPGLPTGAWRDEGQPIDLLVLSHVLNELPPAAQTELKGLIARATAVIWVEPGTHAVARALQQWRDALRPTFHAVAPCAHDGPCGLLAAGNERHWCHHFAAPPPTIFADGDWTKFGQRAGIDLRSLPYAFVALEREPVSAPLLPPDAARIIGRPEHFKGFARLLSCSAAGVEELELQKRADPALFKHLERESPARLYRWHRKDGRIGGATRVT